MILRIIPPLKRICSRDCARLQPSRSRDKARSEQHPLAPAGSKCRRPTHAEIPVPCRDYVQDRWGLRDVSLSRAWVVGDTLLSEWMTRDSAILAISVQITLSPFLPHQIDKWPPTKSSPTIFHALLGWTRWFIIHNLSVNRVNDHGWTAARHLRVVDVISECEMNGSGMEFGIGNVEMRLR